MLPRIGKPGVNKWRCCSSCIITKSVYEVYENFLLRGLNLSFCTSGSQACLLLGTFLSC